MIHDSSRPILQSAANPDLVEAGRKSPLQTIGEDFVGPEVVAEGPAVPARLQPHNGVAHRQGAQEQHDEQQREVEVVGSAVVGTRTLQKVYMKSIVS